MIVDYKVQPRYAYYRKDGQMRLSTILEICETTSCCHSDAVNDDILADTKNGRAWVLTDWLVQVDEYPRVGQKITSKTWVEPITQILFSNRHYEIYADGKLAVRVVSRWILLDLTTGRPQKFDSSFEKTYIPEKKQAVQIEKWPRLVCPEQFSNTIEIPLRRTDIDYNDHVHNLTYFDYAMEAIPVNLYQNHHFKSMRISYKMAVKPQDKIFCKYSFLEQKHICCVVDSNGELKAQIEFLE